MAHVYTLTDGTTTISLVASGVWLENYDMKVPQDDDKTVVDTVDIIINAATGALVQAQAQAIYAMLEAARQYQETRTGARVFVTAQLISDTDTWRAELVGGRMELAEDALAVWGNYKVRATLYLERVPYWEGAETPIPLTNTNGTNNTTGLAIYNNGDATSTSPTARNNHVLIAAADVVGALPAPVKIELKNSTGSAQTLNAIHMANLALTSPSNFPHILEAEDRTTGGTTISDSGCSNGIYLQLTSYTSGQTVVWNLSTTLLQKSVGRWFRLLLAIKYRTATHAQSETVQAEILDSTGAFVVASGPEVSISTVAPGPYPLTDLGAFPLPPGGYDSAWGALKLRLTFRLASGTATTQLDFIQITSTDSYRVLDMRPTAIANNALVVDNGLDRLAYVETSGARAPYAFPRGAPLMVWPGKLQRVYILADMPSGGINIDLKWLVRMWYRPRRVSV